jgi:late competence protein required for DNA uptake (superfamily II DNA/RNA helicase)
MQGFKRHVKKDHNMWAYIYYSMYLEEIDSTNHNAIEKYVYDNVCKKVTCTRCDASHVEAIMLTMQCVKQARACLASGGRTRVGKLYANKDIEPAFSTLFT